MKSNLRNAMAAVAIAVSAAAPAAVAAPTAQINGGYSGYTLVEFLPSVGGRLDAANAKGEIPHSGGLTLTKGTTQVALTDFVIDTAAGTPRLTGLVTANGSIVGRVPLFNLALPPLPLPLTLPPGPEILLVEGSRMTLTQEAATALNGVFGTTAFAAGFDIGIASVYTNY